MRNISDGESECNDSFSHQRPDEEINERRRYTVRLTDSHLFAKSSVKPGISLTLTGTLFVLTTADESAKICASDSPRKLIPPSLGEHLRFANLTRVNLLGVRRG